MTNPDTTPNTDDRGKKLGTVFAKASSKYSAMALDSASAFFLYRRAVRHNKTRYRTFFHLT
jgi:hypothetical protein